jgi:hypothetical protein
LFCCLLCCLLEAVACACLKAGLVRADQGCLMQHDSVKMTSVCV